MFKFTPEDVRLLKIVREDGRFALGAYEFVRDAVTFASHVVYATGDHVSGPQLLEALRRLARDRYGALAGDVFRTWGIRTTDDVGEIVFQLVDSKILSCTENDRVEDFHAVFDLEDAFEVETYWTERLGPRPDSDPRSDSGADSGPHPDPSREHGHEVEK